MQTTVGISNRHIHLTKEDLQILCGIDTLEEARPLTQPGQFASTLKLTIQTPKNKIENVRVLGPTRSYTQVEISKTDAYTLGIDPPVRESGDVKGAALITILGPKGTITRDCAIIATRHIHIDHETREKLGLLDVSKVKVRLFGAKGGLIDAVSIKETNPAYFELHLDTDDGNAHLLKNGDTVEIIKE